ncbi:enoyl-CoA hydratase/isomerase family protein [Mycobacterium sp. NPDC003449]
MTIEYEVRNEVAWLTINRPEARNCLNEEVRRGLFAALHAFNIDDAAKVLVLTGAGTAFCAGGDLKEMSQSGLTIPPINFVPQFGRNIEVAKPTIAAVNGPALAGGFLLVQNCDLCVASTSARFGITEVKVGRGAPWAVPLPSMIPRRIAMEMLVTGESLSAERAYEIGFVNRLVRPDQLIAAAQKLGEEIASNAPLSVAAGKKTASLLAEQSLSDAFSEAERLWAQVYCSADAQEGMRAFAENRRPVWSGA